MLKHYVMKWVPVVIDTHHAHRSTVVFKSRNVTLYLINTKMAKAALLEDMSVKYIIHE